MLLTACHELEKRPQDVTFIFSQNIYKNNQGPEKKWQEKEGEGKINYSNPCNLISVVKMRSLSVKHNFSTSFIEPKTCTRDITLGCIPKLTKKDQSSTQELLGTWKKTTDIK